MFSPCGVESPVLNFCNAGISNDVESCLSARNSPSQRSVPRIKFCLHPRHAKYRRILRKLGRDGRVYYEYLDHYPNEDATGPNAHLISKDDPLSLPVLSKNDEEFTVSVSIAPPPPSDRGGQGGPDGRQTDQLPFLPLLSPISESQVSSRSSERIRSLQASLGGDAFAHRHGQAPPEMAPYYQSGAMSSSVSSPAQPAAPIPLFIHAQ